METMHETARSTAQPYGTLGNHVSGATIAGLLKVAGAMLDRGLV